jgi:hypothetical protein
MRCAAAGSCLLLGLVVSPPLASAQVGFPPENLIWDDFTVDFPVTGQLSSIALEPGGRPHIAYRDLVNGLLKYGRKNDNNSWTVWTVDRAEKVGWGVALALDAASNPHISYYFSRSGGVELGEVRHAKGTCTPDGQSAQCRFIRSVIETRIQNPLEANSTAIAVDTNGVPHVVYVDNTNDKLKWARKLAGSTTWDITNVTTIEGGNVSLALDANNFPHIAFTDTATDQLKYVRVFCQFIICGWSFETIAAGGTMPSLRRAADGKVHVAYFDFAGGAVRYAVRSCGASSCSGSWSLQLVGTSAVGFFPGLALDGAGAPHVSFVRDRPGTAELIYARRGKFGWNQEVADVDVAVSASTSIAVDATNHRHISCGGLGDQSLRHLEGTPPPPPVLLP